MGETRERVEGPRYLRSQVPGLDDLYRRYSGWLGAVLRRQLGHLAAEAEDLVQETYIRASRYEVADVSHPKALLRQIAVNLARDHMRRNVIRGGLAETIENIHESRARGYLTVDPEQESAFLLKEAILKLPVRYRDAFVLSRFTGMSNEEIARHFGISTKAVEWRISKALALCAGQLRD